MARAGKRAIDCHLQSFPAYRVIYLPTWGHGTAALLETDPLGHIWDLGSQHLFTQVISRKALVTRASEGKEYKLVIFHSLV